MSVIALAGDNLFLLNQRRQQLVSDFINEHGDLALVNIDASEADYAAILEAVQSVPFLSPRKMVIVKDPASNRQAADNIEQIISSALTDTDLIIYQPLLDKRSAYSKVLKAKTKYEEYSDMEPGQQGRWLVDQAAKLGTSLSLSDAGYLIDRVGTNQGILYSELEKLALTGGKIDKPSIDVHTERTPQSKIFELLDAIFSGNKINANELYGEQKAQKVEPQAILALVTWQLHLVALAKAGKGKSAAEIAKDAKVNPYPAGKAQKLANKISDDHLKKLIEEARIIDVESKKYSIDLDEALRNYIASA